MIKELENQIQMEDYFLKMYDAAKDAGDEETMELIRNKHTAQEEEIKAKGKGYCWIYRTMRNAAERGNVLPDFYDAIWEQDIPSYIEAMKQAEISQFTISSTMSSMTVIVSAFIENGCELKGMTTVKCSHEDLEFKDHKVLHYRKDVPAFLFEIK